MARVTVDEVKQIMVLDIKTVTDPKIQVFIDQANRYVNLIFSGNTTLSSDILKDIEKNIAAHFLHALDPRAIKEKWGEVAVEYSGTFGEGLNATSYGQTALLLDSTGLLAKAAVGLKQASISTINYSYE